MFIFVALIARICVSKYNEALKSLDMVLVPPCWMPPTSWYLAGGFSFCVLGKPQTRGESTTKSAWLENELVDFSITNQPLAR